MSKITITTDSGCNPRNTNKMAPDIVLDNNNKAYYDIVKGSDKRIDVIDGKQIFEKLKNGEILHTSSPNINDFIDLMTPYLEKGNDIVHISTSNGVSEGSVNASKVASDILNDKYGDKVTVIDSLSVGSGGTIINDYAEDLVKNGASKKEIIEELEEVKHRILSTYYISKVEGFVSSGRAPKSIIISDKLSLRYRVDVNKSGRLMPAGVMRGKIENAFMKYLKNIINENTIKEYDDRYISILKTKLEQIDIEKAKEYINSFNYFDKSKVDEIDFYSAICSYGVIDQIGIGLIKRR